MKFEEEYPTFIQLLRCGSKETQLLPREISYVDNTSVCPYFSSFNY